METKTKNNIKIALVIFTMSIILTLSIVYSAAGRDVNNGNVVIISETDISMAGLTAGLIKGPTEDVGDVGRNSTQINFINSFDTNNQNLINAEYYVIERDTNNVIGSIYFNSPSVTLITKNIDGENIESCVKNSNIYFDIRTNLEHIAIETNRSVDIEIRDANGVKRDIRGIALNNVTGNANIEFDGTDKVGEYTANIKTIKSTCNGVEAKSETIKFNVIESGITLNSNIESQVKTGEVIFSGTTIPNTNLELSVDSGIASNVRFIGGKGDLSDTSIINATIISTSSGDFSFVCDFSETGSYTIKATDEEDNSAKITINIVNEKVTVKTLKSSYCIGEDVKIVGTSNIGDIATISIDDVVVNNATIREDGTFSYRWTSSGVIGSHRVNVEIANLPDTDDIPDATTSFILTSPELSVILSRDIVALDDSFTISGFAKGMNQVEVITFAPKGDSGNRLNGQTNGMGYTIYIISVSQTDGYFEEKIDITKETDCGNHYLAVIGKGRDGYYGSYGDATSLENALESYTFTSKTQTQMIAMLKDATIDAVASDDDFYETILKIEKPSISINPISNIYIGETLTISGTYNRENYPLIITIEDSSNTVFTSNLIVENNSFGIDFDISEWDIGMYIVKVDDSDGNCDEVEMQILAQKPLPMIEETPTPAPTVEPDITPMPTEEPTPETSGFEMMLCIASILFVAYQIRKNK